jgi:hypothetical protein
MGDDPMQTAPHPRPLRVIVEIDPGQVVRLLAQLVDRFTPRVPSAPPPPDPDDEDDDEPAPAHNLPPPVAHAPPRPALPAHVAKTRLLGKPCGRNDTYKDSAYCLRKRSNNGCVACERERDLARKQAKAAPPVRPPLVAVASAVGERPALPPHLALTCFVSPIPCQDPTHRYRDTDFTLRDVRDERCTQCVMQASQQALAGD